MVVGVYGYMFGQVILKYVKDFIDDRYMLYKYDIDI